MCRQVWFPPEAARNEETLVRYLDRLERSCGGHGNGFAIVTPADPDILLEKSVTLSVAECAKALANRSKEAWGIFHTRFVSAGAQNEIGCHPHYYHHEWRDHGVRKERKILLTHNGTWSDWKGAALALRCDFSSDSAAMAGLLSMYGWDLSFEFDQTIMVGIWEKGDKKWQFKLNHATWPLVQLRNGAIASEGFGIGEFEAVNGIAKGAADIESPITVPLPAKVVSRGHRTIYANGSSRSGAWDDDRFVFNSSADRDSRENRRGFDRTVDTRASTVMTTRTGGSGGRCLDRYTTDCFGRTFAAPAIPPAGAPSASSPVTDTDPADLSPAK